MADSIDKNISESTHLRIVLLAFTEDHYIQEATICIESLRKNGRFIGLIDLITNCPHASFPQYLEVHVHHVDDVDNVMKAAGYRLRILEILQWHPEDIFLYLDTDIVCMKDMSVFNDFTKTIDGQLHVYGYEHQGRTQAHENMAGFLTSESDILQQTAWCSGILLFRPTDDIRKALLDTWDMYTDHMNKGKHINSCWEQPFICLVFCSLRLCSITLTKFVMEERHKAVGFYAKIDDCCVFNHFCGLRGKNRQSLMRKYVRLER